MTICAQAPHRVAVVVDLAFGDKLIGLAAGIHVWIVGTPENKAAAERVRCDQGNVQSLERGATTFVAVPNCPPDEMVMAMLDTIDLHHGGESHFPPLSVLQVYGASPTPRLAEALGEQGYTKIVLIANGFVAMRQGRE